MENKELEKRIKEALGPRISIQKSVTAQDQSAIAVKLHESIVCHGGAYGGGITYYNGVSVYDGNSLLSVIPLHVWRDGESNTPARQSDCWGIKTFTSLGNKIYGLQLQNGVDTIRDYVVDMNSLKAERIIRTD